MEKIFAHNKTNRAMAETPAPTNTSYFNTLFYYNPGQGTSSGGSIDTAALLNYPLAQGLENFPQGIQSAGEIQFSSDTSSNNTLANVYDIQFMNKAQLMTDVCGGILVTPSLTFPNGGGTQTVAYIPSTAAYGLLDGSNNWTGQNTFNGKTTLGITDVDDQMTVNSAFTAASSSSCTFLSAVAFQGANNFYNAVSNFDLLPTTDVTNYSTATAQNLITKGYTDATFARLNTNNIFGPYSNTFQGDIYCGKIYTSSQTVDTFTVLTSANINAPTIDGVLTLGTGTQQFVQGGTADTYLSSMPNTGDTFIFSIGGVNILRIDNGGLYVHGVVSQTQANIPTTQVATTTTTTTTNSIVQTSDDVIINGVSWSDTIRTLNELKETVKGFADVKAKTDFMHQYFFRNS